MVDLQTLNLAVQGSNPCVPANISPNTEDILALMVLRSVGEILHAEYLTGGIKERIIGMSDELVLDDVGDDLRALDDLVGKKITKVGFTGKTEGGLTLVYEDGDQTKKIVLGYNDLGTWVVESGSLKVCSARSAVVERIRAFMDSNPCSTEIQDLPMERRYSFKENGNEKLSLSITDLKLLPNDITKHFTTPEPKNVEDILLSFATNVY